MNNHTQHEMQLDTASTLSCKHCQAHLPDLLLLDTNHAADHADSIPGLTAHLAACSACSTELADLRSTFALLDDWTVPEPTPYFDTRLHARLREAEAAQPEGLLERARSFFLFSTGRMLRPALSAALAFTLLIGGGTFATLYQHGANAPASATVNDLKILDNNAQALQQMDQLLDEPASDDSSAPPVT